jgi:bifunctional enzyme CysN/CysC
MAHSSDLIATDIEGYLAEHERKDLLRFLTCGSVDDGKSTLIGRLLHDSNMIYEDHLRALEADSTAFGTTGDRVDLALLMDGLKAEREQGITIDVAYRYFSTARRKFIIADTPGHVEYTRNMVTGASNCQLAVILIDARRGVLDQTRRHSYLAALLGIRHVVVAVNKMDLVDWSRSRFEEIVSEYQPVAAHVGVRDPYYLPMSALLGDQVVERSENLAWFSGKPLMEHLESVDVQADLDLDVLRFPVQLVQRPDLDFRGFAGTVASGVLRVGAPVTAQPSGLTSSVQRLVTFDGDLATAGPGQAVTVTLSDEIDISRGDWLVSPDRLPQRSHDIEAMLVWMASEEATPGQQFLLQSVNGTSNASLRTIMHRVDVNSLEVRPTDRLRLNDIARCHLALDRLLLFDPYEERPTTGSFILIDRLTNGTVAAGMIAGAATGWDQQPSEGLTLHPSEVTEQERLARFAQRPCTVLLTGLTGSGKSTLALAVERVLFDRGRNALRLDGEDLRVGISRDLGFSNADRSENLRRAAEIARLANRQGMIVIVSVQAPEAAVRHRVRELIGSDRYLEVHVDATEETRRARDPNGLYRAADAGEVVDLPGVTTLYEAPVDPDLRVDTSASTVAEGVAAILSLLAEHGFLEAQ